MTMPQSRLTDVLLADDSQADVLLTEEAVALSGQPAQLRFANEGQDALEQLRNTPHDLPRLMLLDVTMPRMNGFEVRAHLKADVQWRRVPVDDLHLAIAVAANRFVNLRFLTFDHSLQAAAQSLRPDQAGSSNWVTRVGRTTNTSAALGRWCC